MGNFEPSCENPRFDRNFLLVSIVGVRGSVFWRLDEPTDECDCASASSSSLSFPKLGFSSPGDLCLVALRLADGTSSRSGVAGLRMYCALAEGDRFVS